MFLQVVIEGDLQDREWLASHKWTNDYLKSTAVSTRSCCICMQSCYVYILLKQQGPVQGACKILVEQKSGDEAFGKGRKVHMTFGELVQQLEQGNDSLYLTTQEVRMIPSTEFAELLNCACCLRQQRHVFVVTSNPSSPFLCCHVVSCCNVLPMLQP